MIPIRFPIARDAGARRGVALVITLLMLSVVTITAVAFLAVSRRERSSVATYAEQIDARYVAEAGLNHAQGRLTSRMAAKTNRLAYGGFQVSTNYQNPFFNLGASFLDTLNYRSLTNVGYYRSNGVPFFDLSSADGRQDYARMLGNLYYDPRPPVFVQTNRNPARPMDFRFYLDLNRNGQFETNGIQWQRDQLGRTNGLEMEWMWGDPEWIGLLQNPDVPHSGTNRFVGRFAYVVVPASRTLDINFFGNDAKRLNLGEVLPPTNQPNVLIESGYLRNQGVGAWEINPAGFLAELNTNIWLANAADYRFRTNMALGSSGLSFSDAERLRRFRQENFVPVSAQNFYAVDSGQPDFNGINNLFRRDFVDGYSDGPLVLTLSDIRRRLDDNDLADKAWVGADLTNHFVDLNDLLSPRLGMAARLTGQYTNRADGKQTSPLSSYDSHTFYRLLSQLGTDSGDSRYESGFHPAYSDLAESVLGRRPSKNPYGFYRRAKLNLNYAPDLNNPDLVQDSARIATFRPWGPTEWFTNAAHRLLLTEFTNGLPFRPEGLRTNVPGLAIHGPVTIQSGTARIRTNHVYDAQVHRLLQVAANIYDARTNRFIGSAADRIAYPTVFRPLFYRDERTPDLLRLHSYQEILGGSSEFLNRYPWVTADQAVNRLTSSLPEDEQTSRTGFNVFGIPWVVGAKKGLPNFNEAMWQTVVQPTRRLRVRRPNPQTVMAASELPFDGANSKKFSTDFQFLVNVTNLFGLELWNSYNKEFKRNVRIITTNIMEVALRDETLGGNPAPILRRRELLGTEYKVLGGWKAGERVAPGYPRTTDIEQFVIRRDTTSPNFIQEPVGLPTTAGTVPGGFAVVTSFIFDPVNHLAISPTRTNEGWVTLSAQNRQYLTPVLSVYVTNHFYCAITDDVTGRLLDFVTLESVMVRTNILSTLGMPSDGSSQGFFNNLLGADTPSAAPIFWSTNLAVGSGTRTVGINNQMLASIGRLPVGPNLWRNLQGPGGGPPVQEIQAATNGMNLFLYGIMPVGSSAQQAQNDFGSKTLVQVGFNPSPRVIMSDRRMANDPLVHYTREDLFPGYTLMTEGQYLEIPDEFYGITRGSDREVKLEITSTTFDLGPTRKWVNAYAPWGTNNNLSGARAPSGSPSGYAFHYAYKDPQIRSANDWEFPVGTNASFSFGGIGQLGRVHRGTPWQTLYLKSRLPFEVGEGQPSRYTRFVGTRLTWCGWAGNFRTMPTNDWKFVDLFTTALNENAARGQMGVNQTNLAAWSALLSAVPVLENADPVPADDPQPLFIEPGSRYIKEILNGYTNSINGETPGLLSVLHARDTNGVPVNPDGVLPKLGSILQVPTLTDRAPFLRAGLNWPAVRNVSDEVLERLPQQILSLLRADEPRFVVYSFGQTLKPAPNAVNLRPGPLYGIATNYTITGEYVTKSVLRLDGDPRRLEPVIESQRVIFSNP
ncbi:MAG: hypothetical protein JNL10_10245 [Verrucomicrobiales bacterium]|nr:hypothetical protein [Verrucomicrobiales bacterium]